MDDQQPQPQPQPKYDVVRNNETILLHFVDGRQLFTVCSNSHHTTTDPSQQQQHQHQRKSTCVRINKRNYTTSHLVGVPYGTIVELQPSPPSNHLVLVPLPPSVSKLIPDLILPPPPPVPNSVNNSHKNGDTFGEEDAQVKPPPAAQHDDEMVVADDEADDDEVEDISANVTTTHATEAAAATTIASSAVKTKDNRHLVDTNTAQLIDYNELVRMRLQNCSGHEIVSTLLEHSTTYASKTTFAQEKYILRKQMKHYVRCRIVQCNTATIVDALYKKDPKKYMNLRDDTMGQLLSYSNICSGCTALVYDDNYGIVLSAMAERMNGNGTIYAIYEQQQPSYHEMFQKFNLTFAQINTIQYVHTSDLFYDTTATDAATTTRDGTDAPPPIPRTARTTTAPLPRNGGAMDDERIERDKLQWPCILHDHTRQYLQTQRKQPATISNFLIKRASRFARKLCRTTNIEAKQSLFGQPTQQQEAHHLESENSDTSKPIIRNPNRFCDSLVLVTKYDPTITLLQLFPYLAPSAPYVIYCEYIEPLAECFKQIQTNPALLSINLRLSDTWMREYQILPNRTHPAMSMSQSGGFILTGIKLHPVTGQNEFSEEQLKEIREEIGGGRRARSNRKKPTTTGTDGTTGSTNNNNATRKRKHPPTNSTELNE